MTEHHLVSWTLALSATASLYFKHFRDGDSAASPGSPFHSSPFPPSSPVSLPRLSLRPRAGPLRSPCPEQTRLCLRPRAGPLGSPCPSRPGSPAWPFAPSCSPSPGCRAPPAAAPLGPGHPGPLPALCPPPSLASPYSKQALGYLVKKYLISSRVHSASGRLRHRRCPSHTVWNDEESRRFQVVLPGGLYSWLCFPGTGKRLFSVQQLSLTLSCKVHSLPWFFRLACLDHCSRH